MPSYVKPQVQVFQEFQVLPTAVVQNLNAFVFGANYQLFRYSVAAEKALVGLGAYDNSTDTEYAYPGQPAGSIVDQDYVSLYMDTVWAQYLQIASAAANPLNVVSVAERNKLRAAPVIGTAQEGRTAGPADIAGVDMDSGGYYVGQVDLPEDYYFYPLLGETNSWKTDISTSSGEDATLTYVTSEGLTGTVAVTNADDPLGAGVWTVGPDGLQLDLDAGVDSELWSPMVVRFTDTAGTSYFDMSIDTTAIKTMVDWAVDELLPLTVNITVSNGANAVSWSDVTKVLTINLDNTSPDSSEYTLTALRAALVGDSDIASYFDFTVVTGTGANNTTKAIDQDAASVATGADVIVIRDQYRIRLTPNPYTFKTANGYSRSAHFKNRDVVVGDRIRYLVVDSLSATHTGTSTVVGLEADKSLPTIADPTVDAANEATQTGTTLAAGTAIVAAGADNQRDFDGANTKVFALDAGNVKYTGELSTGIVDDSFLVTITVSGLEGTAYATVESVNGSYYREDVPIEVVGADDGQIYIGRNLYINLDKGAGDSDAVFQVGDTYTFSTDIEAPYTAVAAATLTSAGAFIGTSDTTYKVEVIRGGVFDRIVNVIDGLQQPAAAVFSMANMDWDAWLGGDIDDEYVLTCTLGGNITTSEFGLESQLGDDATGIQFAAAVDSALGGKGLVGQFDVDDTFTIGDYWVIKVNAARPQVRITDTAGIDNSSVVVINDAVAAALGGYGATIAFPANTNTEGGFCANGGLIKDDAFYVVCTAEADAAVKTLVLSDDMPAAVTEGLNVSSVSNPAPSNFGVWLYLVQASNEITTKKTQSAPDYNWETDADGITVNDDISVQDATWYEDDGSLPWLAVYAASMYVEYRALLPALSDSIHSITDINDVSTELGTITPDNPLAQGVYNSLSNSGNRAVYYMALATDDAAGYDGVLAAASLSSDVYGFVPLTRNTTILNTVEAHINSMSTETNKRWRIGFVGTQMATNVAVYNEAENPFSEVYKVTIADDPLVAGSQYTLVTFWRADGITPAPTEILTDVVVGDDLRVSYTTDGWGDAVYTTYQVASLVSNTSLKLVAGPAAAISVATKAEVWHDYTVAQLATAVAAVSAGFANRRMYHVFPDQLNLDGDTQTSEFGAAAVAGLNSSVAPQQGLTNIELNGFDDLPMVYSTFSYTQLNEMAEDGTFIIMQDVSGGRIYIRHQLSTATADGNLNTTELSVTKNLDSISYYFAAKLEPFIGRYNVTPELLDVLRTQIADGLMYLGSFTSVGLLGPQVILEGTSIQSIEQHATLEDRVVAIVNIVLPYPLNVLELHLVV